MFKLNLNEYIYLQKFEIPNGEKQNEFSDGLIDGRRDGWIFRWMDRQSDG